jgi:cytoskeletal protein RodZ
MERFVEDQNEAISAERWRAWEAKGKRRDKATARKIKLLAIVLIGVLALFVAFHFFVAK